MNGKEAENRPNYSINLLMEFYLCIDVLSEMLGVARFEQ